MITREAYTDYVEKYIDTVFRVAYNYLGIAEDAEDVTQNVFLKLLRERKLFQSEEHVKYWLIRVTINECKNIFRYKWRKEIPLSQIKTPFIFHNPEQSDLYHAVMELPKKYRIPIYLHYYEGYSTQEIGELLNISKNTVCSQLKRGREKIKQLLMEVKEDV